jgi:hypothetical protein
METDTVDGLIDSHRAAQLAGLSQTDIAALCRSHYVSGFEANGQLLVLANDVDKLRQLSEIPRLLRLAKVLGGSFMYNYHSELSEYLYFHDTLDIFCWLLKLRYSEPAHIRRRDYQLHQLLLNYLQDIHVDLEKLGRLRGAAHSAAKIEFHLSKGWYNEIVRSQPLSAHSLRIGPRIN